MKRVLFIVILLYLLPIVGRCQVAGVMAEYGGMLPSRGSQSVIRGQNLSGGLSELAVDISFLPRQLAGVTVDINGVLCGLRFVSNDTIRFVIPDEVSFIPPVRLRPNLLTVRNSVGQVWMRRVYLNDTSPWLIPAVNTNFPVGVQVWPSGWSGIPGGVLQPGSRVQIWATGARSFYPVDWVSYAVWIVAQNGDTFSTPANVSKSGVVEGIDYVTFDVPIEWLGLGACRLILQTPSAFSQEVEVVL